MFVLQSECRQQSPFTQIAGSNELLCFMEARTLRAMEIMKVLDMHIYARTVSKSRSQCEPCSHARGFLHGMFTDGAKHRCWMHWCFCTCMFNRRSVGMDQTDRAPNMHSFLPAKSVGDATVGFTFFWRWMFWLLVVSKPRTCLVPGLVCPLSEANALWQMQSRLSKEQSWFGVWNLDLSKKTSTATTAANAANDFFQ